jgi:hypothetical protein
LNVFIFLDTVLKCYWVRSEQGMFTSHWPRCISYI